MTSTNEENKLNNREEFSAKLKTRSLPPGLRVGVLLLHGLTGMPNEMRPIKDAFDQLGCRTEVPLLPGHGLTSKELLNTGWRDWLAGAQEALDKLSDCDRIFICGLSMGSLLAAMLAAQNPKVCGIVAMSPTIKYDSKNSSNPFQVFLPLCDWIPLLARNAYWTEQPPYGLKDERLQRLITRSIKRAKANGKNEFGQFRTYAGSLRQLMLLVKELKWIAPQVKCPALIMHSVEDTLTSVANAVIFRDWLGCEHKGIIWMTGCDHVLTLDLKHMEVAYNCVDFICSLASTTTSS